MPKVSVLMPVFNGEEFIDQAIESILSQTFSDFELLVIDDASSDKSAEIVLAYKDTRIRYERNPLNLGLSGARNRAIKSSNGEYLAWLDCDDISLPTRLEKQVLLLDNNPSVGLCGTWVQTLGLDKEHIWEYPEQSEIVKSRMIFDDPIATSSAMVRRSCLPHDEPYFDLDYPTAEDYELWERISRQNVIVNIPEVLTYYRIHQKQTSKKQLAKQEQAVWLIQSRQLLDLGIRPSEEEKSLHMSIGVGWRFESKRSSALKTEKWLCKLVNANKVYSLYPDKGFRQVIAQRWFLANYACSFHGFRTLLNYLKSPLISTEPRLARRVLRLLQSILSFKIKRLYEQI
jgi:glycosyltransferase involved in cell wall biosynthesis